jgi:multiple antibiotic resistance protein
MDGHLAAHRTAAMELLITAARDFIALFVIVSPLGAVPLFLGMTQGDSEVRRRTTARIAAIATILVLVSTALGGPWIFAFFGISVDAFRIGGGILLFMIALDFVNFRGVRTKSTEQEYEEGVRKPETGLIPLAIPMLAGPGAITTVMVLEGNNRHGVLGTLALLGSITAIGLVTYVILATASRLQRYLTPVTLGVITRLEGLLLAAIAVELVVAGATNLVLGILKQR